MSLYLGEWWQSNLMFGGAFLVAGLGVFALGFFVLWKDRQNRALLEQEDASELLATTGGGGAVAADHRHGQGVSDGGAAEGVGGTTGATTYTASDPPREGG